MTPSTKSALRNERLSKWFRTSAYSISRCANITNISHWVFNTTNRDEITIKTITSAISNMGVSSSSSLPSLCNKNTIKRTHTETKCHNLRSFRSRDRRLMVLIRRHKHLESAIRVSRNLSHDISTKFNIVSYKSNIGNINLSVSCCSEKCASRSVENQPNTKTIATDKWEIPVRH